jgi:hypothetical protein
MSTPSLLNIPYVIKAGTLYSQIPETGAGDFTVTRATTPTANRSTRVNANGFIELVNDNVPRLDYPLGGAVNGCPALLVEPSAQNLALQSQTFDVSGTWAPSPGGTGSSPSVTANAVISPDGTQNAETVLLNRGAGNTLADQSTLQQTIILATSGTYTFSVYAKATTSGDVGKQILLRIGGGGSLIAYTLTANWVRLTRTETGLASGSNPVQIGNRGTVTADNSVSVDLWGAQVETGSVATSYIPTTTQAITRASDVITKTGIASLIGQTEGTMYVEVDVRNFTNNARVIALSDGTGSNAISLQLLNPDKIRVTVNLAGIGQVDFSAVMPAGVNKIALGYAQNNVALYLNGTSAGTDPSCNIPATNKVDLGNLNGSTVLNDRIRADAVYPNRLSNSELATLTTP